MVNIMSDYRNCFWPDPCKPVSPPSTPCYPPCPPAPYCPPVSVSCGDSDHKKPWIPSYAFKYTTAAQTLANPAAGGNVPGIALGSAGPSTDDIFTSSSGLSFSKNGLYAVWYSVSLGTAAAPTAGLVVGLTLDNSLVPGSTFTTVTNDYNYTKMALVSIAGGQTLAIALTSTGTLSVAQASILVQKIA